MDGISRIAQPQVMQKKNEKKRDKLQEPVFSWVKMLSLCWPCVELGTDSLLLLFHIWGPGSVSWALSTCPQTLCVCVCDTRKTHSLTAGVVFQRPRNSDTHFPSRPATSTASPMTLFCVNKAISPNYSSFLYSLPFPNLEKCLKPWILKSRVIAVKKKTPNKQKSIQSQIT